jgi:RNA polymerase sigma-70 factor (ECF subfamily)
MKDDVAILLAREGNEDAFRRLYDDHKERVFRIAYRYTRTVHDAEDVMQDAFVKAFKKIGSFSFRNNADIGTWLTSICINCAIDHLRKQKRRKMTATIPLQDLIADPPSGDASPEAAAEAEETTRLVREAAQQLTPKQRIAFDLRYNAHHTIREIAGLMNCSENAVKTHLWRSTQKLKGILAPLRRER